MFGVAVDGIFIVAGAGDVKDLDAELFQFRQGHADDAVDAAGALAAADDEEGFELRIELEEGVWVFTLGACHAAADGGADCAHIRMMRELAAAGVEPQEDGAAEACVEAVGFAGDGVGLVNEGAAACFFAGVKRGK